MARGPKMRWRAGWMLPALLAVLAQPSRLAAAEEGNTHERFVHVYLAQWSRTRFNQIVRAGVDFDDAWLAVVATGKTFRHLGPHTQLEWELQAGKYWGRQDHPEVNAIVAARWHSFPWDPWVRNTLALGTGASYAFSVPETEEQGSDTSTRLLQHLMLDLTGTRPEWNHWSLFLRIHHRSGVFGLVADSGSSNFVGLGVRRHF